MKPVSPVLPNTPRREITLGANQVGVVPMPCSPCNNGQLMLSRWELSDLDLEIIQETKSIWLYLYNFGQPPMPVYLTTEHPIMESEDNEFDVTGIEG